MNKVRLNGFRPTHRNKWLLVQKKLLNLQQIAFFEFCLDQMGFDETNSYYGKFELSISKVQKLFNIKSYTTVWNWINKFIDLGLIEKTSDKAIYKIPNPKRYIHCGVWNGEAFIFAKAETNQPVEVIFQNIGIKTQSFEDKYQPVGKVGLNDLKQCSVKALSSSKVKSISFSERVVAEEKLKNDEEKKKFTKSDIHYLNLSALEKDEWLKTSRLEKDIIDVFFNGDWSMYKKHLV